MPCFWSPHDPPSSHGSSHGSSTIPDSVVFLLGSLLFLSWFRFGWVWDVRTVVVCLVCLCVLVRVGTIRAGVGGGVDAMERMRARLSDQVSEGGYYEAHESYKTLFHRLRNKKKGEEAMDVALEGAKAMLRHGHVRCGEELAMLMLEYYARDEVDAGRKSVERVDEVLDALPRQTVDEQALKMDALPTHVDAALKVSNAAIKWIEGKEQKEEGDVERDQVAAKWHHWIAKFLWETLGTALLAEASAHYARAHAPEEFAAALLELAKKGKKEDVDVVGVKGILEMLLVNNCDDAEQMRIKFVEGLEDPTLMETQLGLFGKFSITAIKRKSKELFRMLCQKYEQDIKRDKGIKTLCNRIVQAHFGGGDNPMGMLGGLMKAMMS